MRGLKIRRREAFTLIELMVVLVLIGILSAMILPEMKGTFGDSLLRSSARELVNVFSIAGSRAVSLNQVHAVRLKGNTGAYEIERQMRRQGIRTEFSPVKDVAGSSGEVDSRITVEIRKTAELDAENENGEPETRSAQDKATSVGDQDTIAFYPDGTADSAEVLLRDAAGFGLRLRIDPITARVQILELARE